MGHSVIMRALALTLALISPTLSLEYCGDVTNPDTLCNNPERPSYLVPDPLDCSVFYSCVTSGTGDFTPYHFDCPAGLAFNNEVLPGFCDYRENVPRCNCSPRPKCPEGWTLAGADGEESCYFISREKVKSLEDAKARCADLGANVVEINSEEENSIVVELATQKMTGNNDGLDYWLGAVEGADGEWSWLSEEPMIFSNWYFSHAWRNKKCTQLLRKGKTDPETLDSFYFVKSKCEKESDNAVICEINTNAIDDSDDYDDANDSESDEDESDESDSDEDDSDESDENDSDESDEDGYDEGDSDEIEDEDENENDY